MASGNNITSTSIYSFGGLNRTRKASKNEFSNMGNMSSREYPCLAPRTVHEDICHTGGAIQCAVAPETPYAESIEGLTGIANEAFYYNGVKKSGSVVLSKDMQWEIKKMSSNIGTHYIIHGYNPDKKLSIMYMYTPKTDTFARMGVIMDDLIVIAGTDKTGDYLATFRYGFDSLLDYTVEVNEQTIDCSQFFLKYGNGRSLSLTQNIFEQNFSVGDEVDISGFPVTAAESVGQVFQYKGVGAEVVPLTNSDWGYNNTYDANAGVSDDYITSAFVAGFDISFVSIQGVKCAVHKVYFKLTNSSGETMHFDSMVGTGTRPNYYCCGVTLSSMERAYTTIEIHHNRVWGTSPDGQSIFASASDILHDASSASVEAKYAARIQFDIPGEFTGLCEYRDYMFVFKENCVGIVYGNNPSNYAITLYPWTGCIDRNSIAVTKNGVIYLSHNGFYIFDGTTATCISDKLNRRYKEARSCFDGNIYYTLAIYDNRTPDGNVFEDYEILSYDTRYSTWHTYDSAVFFILTEDGNSLPISDLYYNMFVFCGELYTAFYDTISHKTDTSEDIDWMVTSAPITDSSLDYKSVNEIWIYADVTEGAYFTVYTIADGGEPVEHKTFDTPGTHVFRCPVRAHNCSNYQYKIAGKGDVVIREIEIRKYSADARRYKER
ncbi:MAG: hypothetical protein ACI38A_07460 [Candidatus Ornithomonoglobus sp.]